MSEKTKELFCQPVCERALLSYCFKKMDNYFEISSNVSDKDFLRPEHRLMWLMIGSLIKNGISKLDGSMIISLAQKESILQQIGGHEYVNAVIGLDLDDSNIHYYVNKVLDTSTKYQLYCRLESNLDVLKKESKNDDITSIDMLGKVGADIMNLSMQSKAVKDATNLAEGIDEYIEERRNNPIKICGMSTGFEIFDRRLDGLIPGTLHIVCARPKHGKSTFLSAIAAHVAYELFKPALYIDTEMPFEQWRNRIIAMMSGVPERRVKHGGYNEQEYYNINKAIEIIKKGKLYHEYMPGYNIDKLVASYKKYKYSENIEIGIFDYIKAPPSADFKNKKEYQLLGDVTTTLKDLAGELGVPFFAANQINRQQDIADSDRILRYADVLMFLKPKTMEEIQQVGIDGGTYKLVITDSRRGGTTPEEGIGFNFYKRSLQMSEAKVQLIDYNSSEYKESEEFEYDVSDLEEGGLDDNILG